MTTAQEEAIQQVKEILSEHFEGYLITVMAEVDDNGDTHPSFWGGGYALAYGLAHITVENMRTHERTDDDE